MAIDTDNTEKFLLNATVAPDMAGMRLDQAAALLFPDFSRGRLQTWIRDGSLQVNGASARSKDKLLGGEALSLQAEAEVRESWEAEAIPLDIVFEDETLLVLNKPVGLVVHPAAGNRSGTLLNALLHHAPGLETLPRAGIVHRLDKDTSGLMVVAKTLRSHTALVEQLQAREINREYQAVVMGVVTAGGEVDAPLGRHPVQRTKRAVVRGASGKPALTHYRVLQKYRHHGLLQLKLETGRTHQIRVHMAHIGYPLVGDQIYGGRLKLPKACTPALRDFLQQFRRQALHAFRLGLVHPDSLDYMEWEAELPEDIRQLLTLLEEDQDVSAQA